MTCGLNQRCVLCDPDRGFYERRPSSPYYVIGNLDYEMTHPGQQSHRPHLEFCKGCLERMGINLPPEVRQ